MADSSRVAICRRAGIVSGMARRGDSAWGRKMLTRQGFLAQARAYPDLVLKWRENSRRASKGLPLLPTPSLDPLRKPKPRQGGVRVQRGASASD